jgi:hypothetical protein
VSQTASANVVDIDDPKPWTIKGVSIEARNAAIAAATRQRMTQGEWLTRNILRMVKAEINEERSPAVIAPIPLAAPVPTVVVEAPPRVSMGELQAAYELLAQIGPTTPGARTAKRLLVKQLMTNLGHVPAVKKPKP